MIELKHLQAKNFGPFKELNIPFDKGLLLIEGENRDDNTAESNASGKSNLIGTVGWCITGKVLDERKADDIVFNGEKDCFVVLKFNIGTLERRRGNKTGIYFDGRKIIQEELDEILGTDSETFYSSVFLGQDFVSFYDMKPAFRKQILLDLLPQEILKELDNLYSESKMWLNDCKEDRIKFKQELESVKERIEGEKNRLNYLKDSSENFEQERKERVKKIKIEWRREKNQLKEDLKNVSIAKISDCKEQEKELEKIKKELNNEINLEEKYKKKQVEIQAELFAIKKDVNRYEKEIDVIDELKAGGKCPVCKIPVTEHSKKNCIKEIKILLDAKEKELGKFQKYLKLLDEKIYKVECEIDDKERKTEKILNLINEEKSKQIKFREDKKRIKKALEGLNIRYKNDLKREQERTNDIEPLVEEQIKLIKNLQVTTEKNINELKNIEEDEKLLLIIKDMCGPAGIRARMFDQFMEELQSATDAVLDDISEDLKIEYDTQKEHKKGTVSESLEIKIYENGVHCLGISGGQKQKIRIAVSLALAEVFKNRGGKEWGFMILDEPHRGLDRSGQEKLFKLFNSMLNSKSLILIASPQSDFRSMFDTTIKVVKEEGVSIIQ
jgi:DNA repair exonuclease SbcCD ATPase subunit